MTERTTLGPGEHEVVGALAGECRGELVAEEAGYGDRPVLVGLGGAEHQAPVHFAHWFGHLDPPAEQVEPAGSQRTQLAGAEPRVSSEPDKQPILRELGPPARRRPVATGMLLGVGDLGAKAG